MKSALQGATSLTAFALLCGPAYAQEAPEDAEAGQAIVVTGSRIARPDVDSPVPVAYFGSQDLQRDAAANVMDSLSELPQVGIGNSRTNSNFLTSGTGISTINLRNLGNSRTLTLVNGRRFVSGFAGDSAVDVNNIPTDFIERVDVVTGGQSAVYGSDAIAGVVNFVLKDNFEGIRARAQYNLTGRGDNPRFFASVTAGTKFGADDRGSIMLNYSYDKDKGLNSRDRAISAQDCNGLICGPAAYSVFSPQGQFYLTNGDTLGSVYSFDTDNNLITGQGPGFNRNGVRRIATPVERHLVSAIAKYDITDSIQLYGEGTYAKVRSNASLEASAIGLSNSSSALANPDAPGIGIDNPFIPTALASIIAARNSDADPTNDVTSISARRRFNEVFDRSNRASRDTWRAVVGVRGDITDKWNFDVSYVYGHVTDSNSSEDVDVRRLANALDATTINGEIVCRSAAARLDGCVPINLFGYNTASPEASSYVQAVVPKSEVIKNTQHVLTGSVSGSFAALPAGDIGVAFGGEYRKESVTDDLDILTNTGGNSGNLIPDFSGKFDVWEVFGEVNVPLLANMNFVNYLGLMGQARYSKYSTVGSVFSWNAGAEYSPVEGVRFRGVYARANRAPNNSELFSPASETFASVTDPCDGATATNDLNGFGNACRAIPAVAAAIANSGTFEYTLADLQGINGFVGGNTNLQEETAETITLGAVFTPRAVPGLSVTVDYFNIKLKDAIATTGRNTSIEQCLLTDLDVFCDNVIRNPNNGFVTTVNDQLINVAERKTSGIDLGVRYSTGLGLLENDTLAVQANYTYLINFDIQSNPAAEVEHYDGTVGFSKHRASGRFIYGFNDISLSWQVNYMSGAKADENFTNANPAIVALNDVKSYMYHDVQARFDVMDKKAAFYVGVDNLFDKKPPYLPGAQFAVSPTGAETAADVYDPFGRRFYVGFQFNF
ncbi:TonB-dependent receptor plug domain-containing protein [Novosphingobium sp.]|uniref:TonB-dependent receptor plug domain-containing protein n=1 Tax=Novosphingobium sp. TaxID=1874826 RepID=UPI0028AEE97C|nr:TonB-dependent receptor [Novosphingobium sp.]